MDVNARSAEIFTAADLEYLRGNFRTLDELCDGRSETPTAVRRLIEAGQLPRPSYVLDDGTEYYPPDYFVLVDAAGGSRELRAYFSSRYESALEVYGRAPAELGDDWQAYMEGVYGICLREVTPENIVEKAVRIEAIEKLLVSPRSQDEAWRRALRDNVNGLDRIEREFAPDYDRSPLRWPEPPSRDRLSAAPKKRFPSIFER